MSVFNFIDNLTFPKISFLENFSPIDTDDYIIYRRESRPSLISKNEDIFILTGQFFITCILLLLMKIIIFIVETCLKNKKIGPCSKKLINWTQNSYYLIFNIIYFDFQLVSLAEVGSTKFNSHWYYEESESSSNRILEDNQEKFKTRILVSYFFSIFLIYLMVEEIWIASTVLIKKR